MADGIDVNAQLYRAKSALRCIGKLAGESRTLGEVSGWGLQCLLELIEDELSEVLEAMGGDPDLVAVNLAPRDAH